MFGIYVHIPFCEKKCIYCDFYSIERTEHIASFVDTLCNEITLRAKQSDSYPSATSVFFGGGTPSLLSPEQLERIITTIRNHYAIDQDAEWTMECNPGTISHESLSGYRNLGINRLSFGVQSFNESELAFLHRIHSPKQAEEAIALARSAGFNNVNLDVMFALPEQTMESWKHTLEKVIALAPEHISAYSLIFEEGTPLFTMLQRGTVHEANEENDAEMYEYAINRFAKAGYTQYEVSNFAQNGRECLHNCTYWCGDDYLAFGPSAHGLTDGTRYWNYRSLTRYTELLTNNELPAANSEKLSLDERMFERAFLELRAKGIRIHEFQTDFGINILQALGKELELWESEGLTMQSNGHFCITSLSRISFGSGDGTTLR
ncbi:MAG: radical SAM family heme chaperone HemW [Ignavibacteriae bacterium]|nr:radical SAM family heme chaperone HemW [Ignavibacteriota bacterium]